MHNDISMPTSYVADNTTISLKSRPFAFPHFEALPIEKEYPHQA